MLTDTFPFILNIVICFIDQNKDICTGMLVSSVFALLKTLPSRIVHCVVLVYNRKSSRKLVKMSQSINNKVDVGLISITQWHAHLGYMVP